MFAIVILVLWVLPGLVFAGKITGSIKVKGLRSPAGVLVYLTKAPSVIIDLSNTKFVMDQRNLAFIPHVLPIPVGATVHFPNNDKVDHNIFSLSKAKKFNLGSYKPGDSKDVLFDKPGIVELRCDVHAEMAGYIMVMKNPYWAMTDKKGRLEIPDSNGLKKFGITGIPGLPPGRYFLKTWHEKLKSKRIPVIVKEEGDISVKVNLTRGTPSVLYK
jgi:plastocyanin